MSKNPIRLPFKGEEMFCLICEKTETSNPNVQSGWHSARLHNRVTNADMDVYFCRDCVKEHGIKKAIEIGFDKLFGKGNKPLTPEIPRKQCCIQGCKFPISGIVGLKATQLHRMLYLCLTHFDEYQKDPKRFFETHNPIKDMQEHIHWDKLDFWEQTQIQGKFWDLNKIGIPWQNREEAFRKIVQKYFTEDPLSLDEFNQVKMYVIGWVLNLQRTGCEVPPDYAQKIDLCTNRHELTDYVVETLLDYFIDPF